MLVQIVQDDALRRKFARLLLGFTVVCGSTLGLDLVPRFRLWFVRGYHVFGDFGWNQKRMWFSTDMVETFFETSTETELQSLSCVRSRVFRGERVID